MFKTIISPRTHETRVPHFYIKEDENGRYCCYDIAIEGDNDHICTYQVDFDIDFDIDEDTVQMLDQELTKSYHAEDLNNFYQAKLSDPLFNKKQKEYDEQGDHEKISPWASIPSKEKTPEERYIEKEEPEEPENSMSTKVRSVIDNECSEAEKNLIYDYYGSRKQQVELIHEEALLTGKRIDKSTMSKRISRLNSKLASKLQTSEAIN